MREATKLWEMPTLYRETLLKFNQLVTNCVIYSTASPVPPFASTAARAG
jgi:hypothetical protein